MVKIGYINVMVPGPVAYFSASVTSGVAPLTVEFTDTSGNAPTAWEWNFGDGTANSTEQNPMHTYNGAGLFDVTLTAINAGGSSSTLKIGYVNVTVQNSVVDFSANQTSGIVPLTVQFWDNSSNAISWEWYFGDGTTNSTEPNPEHTYGVAGIYDVTLTVTYAQGNNSTQKASFINAL